MIRLVEFCTGWYIRVWCMYLWKVWETIFREGTKGVPQGPALSPATFDRMNTNNLLPCLGGHITGELVTLSSWLPVSQFLLSLSKVNWEIVVSKQKKANVESPIWDQMLEHNSKTYLIL